MTDWGLDGELRCSVDEKGRVIIPKPFRAAFDDGLHMIRGLSGMCLWLFPLSSWPAQRARLEAQLTTGAGAVDVMRFLRTGARETPDRQGRVLLPTHLREHADLSFGGSVAVLGMGEWIELWNAEGWRKRALDVIERVESNLAAVDLNAMRGDAP
ncbi:MAG: hypothetical protein ABI780_09060 [Ardenticatenales bacterium]